MQIDAFLLHLAAFHKKFNIDTSPAARAIKLTEEMCEFLEALQNESKAAADIEALDVMICSIANVVARGIHNPLFAAYAKLEVTAAKYRLQAKP